MRLHAYGAAKECEVAHTITTAHARPVEHARTRRPLQTSPLCDGEFAAPSSLRLDLGERPFYLLAISLPPPIGPVAGRRPASASRMRNPASVSQ